MKNNQIMWLFVAFIAITLMPDTAFAAVNPLEDTLCEVVSWLTGGVGAGIATLAIMIVGIGALMGKMSWGMAIIVGIGVAIIFGAGQLVELLSVDGSTCV